MIKDEQMIGFGKPLHEFSVTAKGTGEGYFIEELMGVEIKDSEAFIVDFFNRGQK